MTPYMWRNFTFGALTAREGPMDQFFFAIMAFHIQIVSKKAKSMTKNQPKAYKKGGVFRISEMRDPSK